MILRASDRAITDHLARIDIRVSALWRELDAVQLELSDMLASCAPGSLNRYAYQTLTNREHEILAELDRIDS